MKKSNDTMVGWTAKAKVVVALDLSDKQSRWMAQDLTTDELRWGTVEMTRPAVREWMAGAPRSCRVVVEVGTHSGWVTRLLRKLGHRAVMLPPDVLVKSKRRRKKSDETDVQGLLQVARDMEESRPVETIWLRPEEYQSDLALMRSRDVLVRLRTQLVNCMRGTVKQFGERVGSHEVESLPKFARQELAAKELALVEPMLVSIEQLNLQVLYYDKQVEAYLARRPDSKWLLQVGGVGPVIAGTYMAVVGDPTRFAKGRLVAAYIGLTPRLEQSGERNPQLGITKAGCELLRWLLVEGAQNILGPSGKDSDLRRWGLKLAGDGSSEALKKRAVVAVARKLAVLLHTMWLKKEKYEPLRNTKADEATEEADTEA